MKKKWIGLCLLLVFIFGVAAGTSLALETMQVFYFDVDQAEAVLLKGPGFTILIDAGDKGRNDVVPHLQRLDVETIDLLILTHPHADHIGQAAKVLQKFQVAEVWMSGYEHTTRLFEEVLDAILASEADYFEPRRGDVVEFGDLRLEVLNPDTIGKDLHDANIVVRAVYGDVAFLFTGDAEKKTEKKVMASSLPVNVQILQLGHHGSRTSTSLEFLRAVRPSVAIYSAGINNMYGHPHSEVVNRLRIRDIPLYGTDVHGTIIVSTDGVDYYIEVERND